ncbi:WAP four-disulfide core domain protein 2-like [Hyla sarda]|uniref:WAP four-disulfide core domain protein 2-like n=1 Tax=Hyla sarda TaxID=327740 RepID=UPI0024C246E8|nr:WAP four-disulfide core domain protein 2-like [Hyla sarda]
MKLYLLLTFLVELMCVDGANVTQSPAVIATSKPGICPVLGDFTLEICFKKCNNDFECDGVRKCCKTSCNGFQCQIPDEKPGACPPFQNINGTTCDPSVHCTSDNKCEGEQKCCPDGCNRTSCQNPV